MKSIKIKYSWNPLTYKNSTTYQVAMYNVNDAPWDTSIYYFVW